MDKKAIKQVAWVGEEWLRGPIRGVVVWLHGLGYAEMKDLPSTEQLGWAQRGGLVVMPYYGPWCWMNRNARKFVDDVVDAVYKEYGLGDDVPLISTGGSMGGYSSLIYARYSRRPLAACLASCPVCDIRASYNERPDVPRTILYAFRGYAEDLESVFTEHCPIEQVPQMQDIPYLIVHGAEDVAVAKRLHSDPMVAAMRRRRMNVEYIEVPGMGHGGPVPVEVIDREVDFVASFFKS
jgi:dipeptidyl aminopeptidase/acylaminoacyl peptidase